MEYVVEVLTNDVVKERHKFTNKYEAMSMYLELDFKYKASLATYARYRRVK